MMSYEEVKALLDKGFTAEYIMNMKESEDSENKPQEEKPAADPEPEEKPAEDKQAAAVGEMFDRFGEKLDSLIKEMQAANIMNSKQAHDEPMSAEDALAAIIMPQNKNGGK